MPLASCAVLGIAAAPFAEDLRKPPVIGRSPYFSFQAHSPSGDHPAFLMGKGSAHCLCIGLTGAVGLFAKKVEVTPSRPVFLFRLGGFLIILVRLAFSPGEFYVVQILLLYDEAHVIQQKYGMPFFGNILFLILFQKATK